MYYEIESLKLIEFEWVPNHYSNCVVRRVSCAPSLTYLFPFFVGTGSENPKIMNFHLFLALSPPKKLRVFPVENALKIHGI